MEERGCLSSPLICLLILFVFKRLDVFVFKKRELDLGMNSQVKKKRSMQEKDMWLMPGQK